MLFDAVILGKGLIGSAAARHLSAASRGVAVIGPDEPEDKARHTGVFASHYDQGRITRRFTKDLVWAELTHRSMAEYARIEKESGIRFYHPLDGVHVAPRGAESVFLAAAPAIASRFQVSHTAFTDWRQVADQLPMLRFPDGSRGVVEHAPAGYINPRQLIRAQLEIAARQGAAIFRETAIAVRHEGDRLAVSTREGRTYRARKVLVATGAYASSDGLLPRRLALRIKSETVLMARLPPSEVERLRGMPSVVHEIRYPSLDTIYMLPPIEYPGGGHYIKMGCNTIGDRELTTPEQMNAWVREGDSDVAGAAMIEALRAIVPGIEALSFETKRCLVDYTPHGWPFVDQVGRGLYVAAGGNGLGAKSSDAIGRLAADLMAQGAWVDSLDARCFEAELASLS